MRTTSHDAAVNAAAGDGRWIATVVASAIGMLAIGVSLGSGGSLPHDPSSVVPPSRTAPAHVSTALMSRADSPEANPASSPTPPASEAIPPAAVAATDDAPDRATPAPSLTRLIKINTATASELELLPGIGPAMAARIITHRTEKGPFRSKSDLDQVRGVGEKTLERLLPLVSFELPAAAASASNGR